VVRLTGERGVGREHLARDREAGLVWRARRAGLGWLLAPPTPLKKTASEVANGWCGPSAPTGERLEDLVTVKRVEDYESKIKVKPDNSWIVTEGVNLSRNPFDEIAWRSAAAARRERALRSGGGQHRQRCRASGDPLALAMGADRGILIKHDDSGQRTRGPPAPESDRQESPTWCLWQAGGGRRRQCHRAAARRVPRWARRRSLRRRSRSSRRRRSERSPASSWARQEEPAGGARVDGASRSWRCSFPRSSPWNLRLNVPRYAEPAQHHEAKKKPSRSSLPRAGVDVAPKVKVVRVEAPPARAAGVKSRTWPRW